MYKPKQMNELRTPVKLIAPSGVKRHGGAEVYTYPEDGALIFVSWKSYGGTESVTDGVLSIIDTAQITTWYRPDIKANCRIKRQDGALYEIISEPEDIELGGRYCQFKVQRIKGAGSV